MNNHSLHLMLGFPPNCLLFGLLGWNPGWVMDTILPECWTEVFSDVLLESAPKSHPVSGVPMKAPISHIPVPGLRELTSLLQPPRLGECIQAVSISTNHNKAGIYGKKTGRIQIGHDMQEHKYFL